MCDALLHPHQDRRLRVRALRAVVLAAPLLTAACTTTLPTEGAPLPATQRVRLDVPLRVLERTADSALSLATLMLYYGAWDIETLSVDGTQAPWRSIEMPPGPHRVDADVAQGTPTELGLLAHWRCHGHIEHDFRPGDYVLVFNRDKRHPQLQVEANASRSVVATAACEHINAWNRRPIID